MESLLWFRECAIKLNSMDIISPLISFAKTAPAYPGRVKNFEPIGHLLSGERSYHAGVGPSLDILEYCEREQFTELIVSTPG